MNSKQDEISVLRYDAIAQVLRSEPELSHEEVASRCRVAASTVERIRDGSISRPAVVVLERLAQPRRCPQCGALCKDWPCIFCEMRRRRAGGQQAEPPRFQYRSRAK